MRYLGMVGNHSCSTNQAIRKVYGCDGAGALKKWEMLCPRCVGDYDNCTLCNGNSWIEMDQCINSIICESTHELSLLIESLYVFDAHNILPCSGAWLDQSQKFREIYSLFNSVKAKVDDRKEDRKKVMNNLKGKIDG